MWFDKRMTGCVKVLSVMRLVRFAAKHTSAVKTDAQVACLAAHFACSLGGCGLFLEFPKMRTIFFFDVFPCHNSFLPSGGFAPPRLAARGPKPRVYAVSPRGHAWYTIADNSRYFKVAMKRRIFVWCSIMGGVFYFGALPVAQAGHGANLVVSEVQITGGAGMTTNDFVEIYNPTSAPVDLDGVRLVKRTATGTTDTTLKSWTSSAAVPAHGWYLWANSAFTTIAATPDTTTTGTLADGNGVALRMGAEDTGVIIDSVGWGTAMNAFVEGTVFPVNPGAGASIERMPGGTEGNGTDTNVNASDFMLRDAADPQNSASAPAPPLPAPPPPPPPPPAPAPPMPGDLVVNEFMPNPTDGIEWVELYNKTAVALDMTGWKLVDGTDATVKSLSGTIAAGGFAAFDLSSARLNNSGDTIVLMAPDGTIIDRVSYGDWDDGNVADNAPASTKAGQSVARKSNGGDSGVDSADFTLSDGPTKGASNVIVETLTGGRPTELEEVQVAPAIVRINEFVSDPADGEEWVELYNAGITSVDLEGFWLEEGSERKTKLAGTLIPGQFLVAEKIAGNLNNAGDVIRLKNPKGEVIDWVSYGVWEDGALSDNARAASDPNSTARIRDGEDSGVDRDDFTVTVKPTPGMPNVIKAPVVEEDTPAQTVAKMTRPNLPEQISVGQAKVSEAPQVPEVTGKLLINEILPDPEGSDEGEFIELLWLGTEPLDLKGFQIDDAEGGSHPFTLQTVVLQPRFHLLLPRTLTRITLNNDGDSVRLFDSIGALLDEIEYEGSVEGASYARRADGRWFWTTPTPGKLNVFSADARAEADSGNEEATGGRSGSQRGFVDVALGEVRGEARDAKVRVRGNVAVAPGVLGSQFFYVVDADAGLQIYMYKKDFPSLALGDRVRVQGILGEAGGESRIKVRTREDIVVEGKGPPPEPQTVSAADVEEELEGSLVKLEGTIIDVGKGGMMLADDGGEVPLVIKEGTGINARELAPGTKVSVAGIVSQTRSGYRVLPRAQEDIEVLGREEVAGSVGQDGVKGGEGKESGHPYATATAAAGGGAALASFVARRRRMLIAGARAVALVVRRGRS